MKILALKWRRLGDTILWTAALDALLQQFPAKQNHQIDIAYPESYNDLFAGDPRFHQRFALNEKTAIDFAPRWRERGYDLALGFHVSPKTRALVRAAKAKETILHHHDRAGKNFGSDRRVVHLGEPQSAIERDLNVIRTIGWQGTSPAPRIHFDPAWAQTARATWPRGEKPRVLLGPAASRPAKLWPLERYAQLAQALQAHAEVGILYDQESAFRGHALLRARLTQNARLVPTPRLREAIGHLSLAACYAGSDSGIKHLAAAVGIPTVTFFGPESLAEWHGYDEKRHTALQVPVGCRTNDADRDPRFAWCGVEVCPLASHACLTLIDPREAKDAILRHLP